jgi:hypothetical protein
MTPISCHNSYHIGDCLITAHLLRALAKAHPDRTFWFFLNGNIITQISEAVYDIPNISLFTFESAQWQTEKHRSIDTWKNADHHWEKSPYRWDWVLHTLDHHWWTAKRLGFESPLRNTTDLLFDYPALGPSVSSIEGAWTSEFLVVNSDPQSGQLSPMHHANTGYLDKLIYRLGKNHSVMTTQPTHGALCTQAMGHSVSMIGQVSVRCKHHICIATGPMWPMLNVHNHHLWNTDRKRIVILDNGEKLTGIPWIQQVSRVEEAEDILRAENLI